VFAGAAYPTPPWSISRRGRWSNTHCENRYREARRHRVAPVCRAW